MATQGQATAGLASTRDAIRWGLLLSAIAVSGFRLPRVYQVLAAWREVRFSDPSAADVYWTNFEVTAVGIAVVLSIGIGSFYLLRTRTKTMSSGKL